MTYLSAKFDNSYARELEGMYQNVSGAIAPAPKMLAFNIELAHELGLDAGSWNSEEGAQVLSGSREIVGSTPLAMAYSGHQFGGFSPSLGDGRAMLLGEIIDVNQMRRDLHLKGSGRTPFSRGGDGKAVIGPVLREYLMGEAMHALGVPTTRALAAVSTGEDVMRERLKPGAVLARIADSHIRVGTFQFFAARGQIEELKRLVTYTTARHFPETSSVENQALALLQNVVKSQAGLIAKWVSIGFVHGVMNTDNMAISGQTIDYGPCAFIDGYDEATVFSSIDRNGRYAFGNQAAIAQWNLARLAEALLPLIDENEDCAFELASAAITSFEQQFDHNWSRTLAQKIGINDFQEGDHVLVKEMLGLLAVEKTDYTSFFRALSRGDAWAMFDDSTSFETWQDKWIARVGSVEHAQTKMDAVNPIYIPRNHIVDTALRQAEDGDMRAFDELLDIMKSPFVARVGFEKYAQAAPKGSDPIVTYCGT